MKNILNCSLGFEEAVFYFCSSSLNFFQLRVHLLPLRPLHERGAVGAFAQGGPLHLAVGEGGVIFTAACRTRQWFHRQDRESVLRS